MRTALVDVHLGRDSGFAQRQVELDAVSTGTVLSEVVWNRNVGGVCGVTCNSFERLSTSLGSGLSPSSICIDPRCANWPNVITG